MQRLEEVSASILDCPADERRNGQTAALGATMICPINLNSKTLIKPIFAFQGIFKGRRDTQHNSIGYNVTLHSLLNCDVQHNFFSKCHLLYCYAECLGTFLQYLCGLLSLLEASLCVFVDFLHLPLKSLPVFILIAS